jgi:DNA-binding response OmpR family regulator
MAQRIVIIEDEKDIVELLDYTLRKEGFDVRGFAHGREGLEALRRGPADLAVIDIMLPDISGLEICKLLRADENLRRLPIIFLTAKGEEIDRILGLEIGADDYMVKPFSPRELAARIKAVLRRQGRDGEEEEGSAEVIEAGGLRLDPRTQEAIIRGQAVELSSLEFKLLHFLASHPRRIFPRESLLDRVWGRDRFVTPRTVDVHIRRLREKIEIEPNKPQYLQTVRGSGYRFSASVNTGAGEGA